MGPSHIEMNHPMFPETDVELCYDINGLLVHMHFRVYVYRNRSRAINYLITIKHDHYIIIQICLISP